MTKEKIQKPGLISNMLKMALLLPVLIVGLGIGGKAQDFEVELTPLPVMPICSGGNFEVFLPNNPDLPDSCNYSFDYQWQWLTDPTGSWGNIPSNLNTFEGTESPSLSGMDIPEDYNGYFFRLVVSARSNHMGCDTLLTGMSDPFDIMVNTGGPVDALDSISITPSNGTQCPGAKYTLTAMPMFEPSTQIYWYLGDPEDDGQPLTPIEGSASIDVIQTGIYYARRETSCGNTTAVSLEVIFKTESSLPELVTATPPSICAGDPVSLTASGGDAGTGSNFYWYSNPNDPYLDIGPNITQSPSVGTTYYVRRQGDCNTTGFKSVFVGVKETPQAFTNITAEPLLPCAGKTVKLTASGGEDQADQSVVWYDSPNGTGMELGRTKMLNINFAEDKTYYVRRENGCPDGNSPDFSKEITTLPAPVATIEMPTEVTCVGETVTFQATEDPNIIDYQWTFTGATPGSHNGPGPVEVVFNVVGLRTVSLVVNNGSCTDNINASIDVLSEPTLLLDDVPLTSGVETFTVTEKLATTMVLSSNLPAGIFSWSCEEDDPGSLAGGAGSGTDSLVRHNWVLADKAEEAALTCMATVTQGNCENMAEFKILVKRLIFVPNVLTANGDEFNQCWEIELGPDIQFDPTDFEIELYSRGGECVRGCQETFTVADAVEMCGEDCPGAGAYWYVIKGPEGFSATGALTIIK